jgi:O-antigen ligase
MKTIMKYLACKLLRIRQIFRDDFLGSLLISINYVLLTSVTTTIMLFSEQVGYNHIPVILSIIFALFATIYILLRGRFYFNYYIAFLFAFLIYSIVITLFTTNDFSYIRVTINVYLLCFIIIQLIINTRSVGALLNALLLSVFIFSLVFFIRYKDDIASLNIDRLGNYFGNVNSVGIYFTVGIFICVYYISLKKRYSFFLIIPILLFLFLAFTTGSKKALFMPLLSLLVGLFLIFTKKRLSGYLLTIGFLIISVFGLMQLQVFSELKNRIIEMLGTFIPIRGIEGDASTIERLNMSKDGLWLWLQNILFGHGSGGFLANTNYGTYSHANLIEILANFGLVGFFLFHFPFLSIIRNRKNNAYNSLILILLISLVLPGSFSVIFYHSKILMILLSAFVCSDFIANSKRQAILRIGFDTKKPYAHIEFNRLVRTFNI